MKNLNNLEQDLKQYKLANTKPHNKLTAIKLLSYTAAASSAFVFSAAADASIIYSGVQNTGLNTPVDIDGDGITDITLSINTSSSTYAAAYMLTPNETAFIRDPGGNLVKKLSLGSSIDAGANFIFNNGTFRAATTSGFSKGNFNTSSGFAGIKIRDSGSDIFAWLRFSITNGTNGLPINITLKDWAYENTGAPILAGQTVSAVPLPGSLGLLAMGASGLAAFRRRKTSEKK